MQRLKAEMELVPDEVIFFKRKTATPLSQFITPIWHFRVFVLLFCF